MTAKTWDELYGDKATQDLKPVQPIDLSALEGMSRTDLEALCARLLCQCGAVALMTDEQAARAIMDRMIQSALTTQEKREAREAGKEALNRIQGTAIQRTAMMVKTDSGNDDDDDSAVDAFLRQFIVQPVVDGDDV